jgi:uncharacterized protein involved in outer membrane biogenesis
MITKIGVFFKWLFITVILLLSLLVITIMGFMYFGVTLNLEFIKGGVETSAQSALGRKVLIEGPVSLEFSNWPAIEVRDVQIANLPDAIDPVFLDAGLARLQIGLFPLLKGNIQIGEISAENVTLNLENNGQGQPNWVFGEEKNAIPESAQADRAPVTTSAEEEDKSITFSGLDNLTLNDIAVTYHDAVLDKTIRFKLDNLSGEAPPGKQILLDFAGNLQKNSYAFEFQGGPIEELMSGREPWPFKLTGDVAGKKIVVEGDMAMRNNEPAANLGFKIEDIDVGVILSRLGLVEGLKASTGSMEIKLGLKGDSLDKIVRNSSMSFSLRDGQWRIASPTSEAFLDVEKLTGDILVEQENAVTIKLAGMVDKSPVKFVITGAPLVQYVSTPETVPLTIDVEFANSYLSFGGELALPVTDRNLNLFLKFKTDKLDNLNEALRLDLPSIGPVAFSTGFELLETRYELSNLDLQVGESRLEGKMSLDASEEKPEVNIELISKLLRIDDFDAINKTPDETSEITQRPASDETENADENVAEKTDKKGKNGERNLLSRDVLSSFNAELLVKAEKVTSGDDNLGSGEFKMSLKDSLLALAPLRMDVPGGIVQVELDYLPTEENITVNLNADIDKFDIGVLVRRIKPEVDMGGMIYLNTSLHSKALDFSTVMENAEGHFDFGLVPQNFSAGVIDMWAVNLISSIMTEVSEKEQSEVNCVVVRFGIENGLMEEKAIYMDTSNMRVDGKAEINFKTGELNILMVPKAKKPEFFSLAVPIKVDGKLDDFGMGIGVGRLTGAIFSFITSPIHVPIRKIFADKIPEDGQKACRQAWALTGEGDEKSAQ